MKPFIILIFSFFVLHVNAQKSKDRIVNTQQITKEGDSVYQAADFPGGIEEWARFVERNITPQTPGLHNAPAGTYTVTAGFIIDTAGNVTEVQIVKDPGYGTAKDVKRLLSRSPKWLPATINGKPVSFRQKENFTYEVDKQ